MKYLVVFFLIACASTQLPPLNGNDDKVKELEAKIVNLQNELKNMRDLKNKWKDNAKFHEALYIQFDELESFYGAALECCLGKIEAGLCSEQAEAFENKFDAYYAKLEATQFRKDE